MTIQQVINVLTKMVEDDPEKADWSPFIHLSDHGIIAKAKSIYYENDSVYIEGVEI